jgi:phage-related protein
MAKYQIYKVKMDSLEAMGQYEASSPQVAVNNMAKRGNLVGREWSAKYLAIPVSYVQKKYTPTVK